MTLVLEACVHELVDAAVVTEGARRAQVLARRGGVGESTVGADAALREGVPEALCLAGPASEPGSVSGDLERDGNRLRELLVEVVLEPCIHGADHDSVETADDALGALADLGDPRQEPDPRNALVAVIPLHEEVLVVMPPGDDAAPTRVGAAGRDHAVAGVESA